MASVYYSDNGHSMLSLYVSPLGFTEEDDDYDKHPCNYFKIKEDL